MSSGAMLQKSFLLSATRRCCRSGSLQRILRASPRRSVSEYVPLPPSPNDLKAPLPDEYSVAKNLKLKAILFEYNFMVGSSPAHRPSAARRSMQVTSSVPPKSIMGRSTRISNSTQQFVSEISDLMSKASQTADVERDGLSGIDGAMPPGLKEGTWKGGLQQNRVSGGGAPRSPPRLSLTTADPGEDPKAKYMSRILEKTGKLSSSGEKAAVPAGDADLLLAAKERIGRSGWMLREGVGELLLYLASRSVRLGVIASPRTTNTDFNNFMGQLCAQSMSIRAAISPDAVSDIGVEAGVARACADLDVGNNSAIMVVGSSDAILRAAHDAGTFTTRFYPPNSVREGVIQSFVARHVDETTNEIVVAAFTLHFQRFQLPITERYRALLNAMTPKMVRTIVEQLNGVSYR